MINPADEQVVPTMAATNPKAPDVYSYFAISINQVFSYI